MRPSHQPPGLRNTLLALVAAAILAACTSSSGNAITPLKATPTTVGATATTTTAVDPMTTTTLPTGDSAIIAVDRAAANSFIAAGSSNPVQPGYPELVLYVSGKQLATDRELLTQLGLDRRHYVGTYVQTNFVVAQHIGDQAVVLSCAMDDTAVVDNASGVIATPSPHSRQLVNDMLTLINGKWMVTDKGVRSPTC